MPPRQRARGLIGPDLDWVGDKNPEQYDYSHLPGRPSAFRWQAAHFQDPRGLVPDTVMPNFHFSADEIRALTLLAMSWRRAPLDASLTGNLPRNDPQPEEERRLAAEMERGPGGWFVRTGCYTCHPVSVFGVKSPTPIGPICPRRPTTSSGGSAGRSTSSCGTRSAR